LFWHEVVVYELKEMDFPSAANTISVFLKTTNLTAKIILKKWNMRKRRRDLIAKTPRHKKKKPFEISKG